MEIKKDFFDDSTSLFCSQHREIYSKHFEAVQRAFHLSLMSTSRDCDSAALISCGAATSKCERKTCESKKHWWTMAQTPTLPTQHILFRSFCTHVDACLLRKWSKPVCKVTQRIGIWRTYPFSGSNATLAFPEGQVTVNSPHYTKLHTLTTEERVLACSYPILPTTVNIHRTLIVTATTHDCHRLFLTENDWFLGLLMGSSRSDWTLPATLQ